MKKTFVCIALLISAAAAVTPAMAEGRNDTRYQNTRVEYNVRDHDRFRQEYRPIAVRNDCR